MWYNPWYPIPALSFLGPLQDHPVPSSPHFSTECLVLACDHPIKSLTHCPHSRLDSLYFHLIIITNASWGLVCNRPHGKAFAYFESVTFPTLNYYYCHLTCLETDLVSSFVGHTGGKSNRPRAQMSPKGGHCHSLCPPTSPTLCHGFR